MSSLDIPDRYQSIIELASSLNLNKHSKTDTIHGHPDDQFREINQPKTIKLQIKQPNENSIPISTIYQNDVFADHLEYLAKNSSLIKSKLGKNEGRTLYLSPKAQKELCDIIPGMIELIASTGNALNGLKEIVWAKDRSCDFMEDIIRRMSESDVERDSFMKRISSLKVKDIDSNH